MKKEGGDRLTPQPSQSLVLGVGGRREEGSHPGVCPFPQAGGPWWAAVPIQARDSSVVHNGSVKDLLDLPWFVPPAASEPLTCWVKAAALTRAGTDPRSLCHFSLRSLDLLPVPAVAQSQFLNGIQPESSVSSSCPGNEYS